eukprot:4552309-Pleurochrysis_carterae.AAC.2
MGLSYQRFPAVDSIVKRERSDLLSKSARTKLDLIQRFKSKAVLLQPDVVRWQTAQHALLFSAHELRCLD